MLRKQFTIGLIALIAIISTTMLIGARFDAIWAGGEGYKAHQRAYVGAVEYRRGETIESTDTWLKLTFANTTIWMDQDTQVKLIDGRTDQETIQVLQGRVVVEGDLTIEVRALDLEISGVTSFVHYSWLNEIDIANISGTTRLTREDRSELIERALKTTTLPPYTDESISFEPNQSSAAEFYNWALGTE